MVLVPDLGLPNLGEEFIINYINESNPDYLIGLFFVNIQCPVLEWTLAGSSDKTFKQGVSKLYIAQSKSSTNWLS